MPISHADLRSAERTLRRYDKALRLRESLVGPTVLIERKTYRGQIGATLPGGHPYLPDSGARKELGHVHVGAIHWDAFDARTLLDSLKTADTWGRGKKPLWQRVQEADDAKAITKRRTRQDEIRYRASQLFDSYVWKYNQRVNVPVSIV